MRFLQSIVSAGDFPENRIIDYKPGVNILYGENNTGKSLSAKAIIDTMLGFFSSSDIISQDVWERMVSNLTIEVKEKKYQFIRSNNAQLSIISYSSPDKQLKLPVRDARFHPDKVLTNGSIDPELKYYLSRINNMDFLNLSFITPDFEDDFSYQTCIDSASKVIFNDESNIYRNIKNFKEGFSKLVSDTENFVWKNLEKDEKRLMKIDRELKILDIQLAKISKLEQEKERLQNEKASSSRKINDLKNRMGMLERITTDIEELGVINRKIEKIETFINGEEEKKKQVERKISKLDKIFPEYSKLSSEQKDKLELIQGEYKNLIQKNDEIFKKSLVYRMKKKKNFFWLGVGFSLLIFPVLRLLKFYSISFLKIDQIYFFVFFFSLSGLIILLSIGNLIFLRYYNTIDALKEEQRLLEEKFKALLTECNIRIGSESIQDLYEMLVQYFETYGIFIQRKGEVVEMGEDLISDDVFNKKNKNLINLRDQKIRLEEQVRENIKFVGKYVEFDIYEYPLVDMKSEISLQIKSFENDIMENENLVEQIDLEMKSAIESRDNLVALEKEKYDLEKRINKTKSKKSVVEYTVRAFDTMLDEKRNKLSDDILCMAESMFVKISGNSYVEDFKNFKNSIKAGNIYCFGDGSRAVSYIEYLSVKLALYLKVKESGFNVPLIIDDPSLYLDNIRRNNFIETIKELPADAQILILTHDADYFGNFGNHISIR